MAGFSLGRDPYLLGRQGLAGALRIGVSQRKYPHCRPRWVAVDGIPLTTAKRSWPISRFSPVLFSPHSIHILLPLNLCVI